MTRLQYVRGMYCLSAVNSNTIEFESTLWFKVFTLTNAYIGVSSSSVASPHGRGSFSRVRLNAAVFASLNLEIHMTTPHASFVVSPGTTHPIRRDRTIIVDLYRPTAAQDHDGHTHSPGATHA
jgi:hypothetical protein